MRHGKIKDDQIDFRVAGQDQFSIIDGVIEPITDDDIDLGASAKQFKNLFVDGVAFIDEYDIDGAGTYKASMPTNGVAADAKFMLGTSTTIIWMYLNAAPPGWKVLTTGADTVLAVSGGAAAYSGNGGTQGGSHSILEANIPAHTHTIAHTHTNATGAGGAEGSYISRSPVNTDNVNSGASSAANSGSTGSGDGLFRAAGSIGKLFQLDTA